MITRYACFFLTLILLQQVAYEYQGRGTTIVQISFCEESDWDEVPEMADDDDEAAVRLNFTPRQVSPILIDEYQ